MGFFQHILGLDHFKLGFQSGHIGIQPRRILPSTMVIQSRNVLDLTNKHWGLHIEDVDLIKIKHGI
jgi:hypothetical protein